MRVNLSAFTLYKAASVSGGTAVAGTHRCLKRIYVLSADFRVDSSCWTGFLLDQDTNYIQGDANYRLDYSGFGVAL
jgi:hypothetical protein